MKQSIRRFLLINLLLTLLMTTTLTAIGNYYLDQKDIQEHLDTLMAISALSYQALLGDDIQYRPLNSIQSTLKKIPETIEHYYPKRPIYQEPPSYHLDKFNFQVWNKEGQLLLHSSLSPMLSLTSQQPGFSDKTIDDQSWRLFTTGNNKAGASTVLAERYDTRNDLAQRIAQDDIYIMLLMFPLSGILIWMIIGHGLRSLNRITKEVANRAPSHLESVNISKVPNEIKPLIDELNKLFNRLKEGFEREKRFAADAAHELRTPLAALKAQVQVALNTDNLEEKNIALQKVIASVNRSTHVVQQLLIMSKLVPEQFSMSNTDEVNLSQVTRDVLAMLAPSAVEKQIELSFEPEKSVPSFSGNPTAIGILVRNLVDNAIRYCNQEGRVDVFIYKKNQDIVLSVQDDGPGIPTELQARVFERFYRVLGNKSPGSGLGLAIVHQICLMHQARIELASPKKGHGLIVNVYFHA